MTMDRFPEGAYIEDGLLIIGDEAWTPVEFALFIRTHPDYQKKRIARNVRRWREKNPERAREIHRQSDARARARKVA